MLVNKAFLCSYYHDCCFFNSNNQQQIHHIHCFRCISCHQSKTKKSCWLYNFLFYDFYFKSYSLNVSNISYSKRHLCTHYDVLWLQQFCFFLWPFMRTIIIYKIRMYLWLFHLPFYQPLICLNYHQILI